MMVTVPVASATPVADAEQRLVPPSLTKSVHVMSTAPADGAGVLPPPPTQPTNTIAVINIAITYFIVSLLLG
jgi:hypothetical protein